MLTKEKSKQYLNYNVFDPISKAIIKLVSNSQWAIRLHALINYWMKQTETSNPILLRALTYIPHYINFSGDVSQTKQ